MNPYQRKGNFFDHPGSSDLIAYYCFTVEEFREMARYFFINGVHFESLNYLKVIPRGDRFEEVFTEYLLKLENKNENNTLK